MTDNTVEIPMPNLSRPSIWKDGETEYLYRFARTKSGKFRVYAIYTGLAVGSVGSGGKSFGTESERVDALVKSVALNAGKYRWSVVCAEVTV